MWKWVSFAGRWIATAAFAAVSVAASAKPEDAVSSLAAWWQYVTTTDTPAWLKTAATDRVGFAGRWCFGKTPMQTFLDSLKLAREKQNPAMAA